MGDPITDMSEALERDLRRLGEIVPVPLRPMVGVTEADARRIRIALRKLPTQQLKDALAAARAGVESGIALVDRNRVTVITALEEMLSERGELWRRK